jgi:hypothetical protein
LRRRRAKKKNLHFAWNGGMTVCMKDHRKNILPFPKPAAEPDNSRIVVQIGNERFAIHYEIEELPPVPPPLRWKRPGKKAALKIVR